MTGLLETFERSSDEPILRGELDGAAWRFVLPRRVDVIEVHPTDSLRARDLAVLHRSATVVEVAEGESADRPVDLVVGDASSSVPRVRDGVPLAFGFGAHTDGTQLVLRYENDELRGVAPVDGRAGALLERHVGPDGPVARTFKQRLRRKPARIRRSAEATLHGAGDGPPAWLVERAGGVGIDLSAHSWALWCRGDYASQKLVMFLLAAGEREPSTVVKITRDARFNERLDNESRMLQLLAPLSEVARGGAPHLRFTAEAWGSAVSVQSAVVGDDLQPTLRSRPELIDRVAAWTIALANETRTQTSTDELHRCLTMVVDRYAAAYDIDEHLERFLRQQVEAVVATGVDAVVQHGDPGPWNAVITADDRVAFLDWEAGEPRGLPLWDLLYFLRSAGLTIASRPLWQRSRTRTRRDFVDGSEVGDMVARHVRDYVRDTGLDAATVEPLFHLCWAHRAVKHARRLPPRRRSSGLFHRMVVDGVRGRDQPGLRRVTMRDEIRGERS